MPEFEQRLWHQASTPDLIQFSWEINLHAVNYNERKVFQANGQVPSQQRKQNESLAQENRIAVPAGLGLVRGIRQASCGGQYSSGSPKPGHVKPAKKPPHRRQAYERGTTATANPHLRN
jgi:hypothetical protein